MTEQNLWERAIEYHQNQEWEKCLDSLNQLIHHSPNHIEGIRLKANVLEQIDRWEEAVKAYETALSLAPSCFELNHELGRLLWKMGRHQESLPLLESATKINPQSYQAWADLGVNYYILKNLDQAAICLTKSLEILPDRADTIASLAVVYAEKKEIETAISYFEKSLNLDPNNAQTLCNYGALLSQAHQPDKAIIQYQKAIEIQPNLAHAYSNLGVLLREIGKLDEGIEQCRKAIEINPNLAEAYSNLSLLLKEKGELDEAIELCYKALEINPNNLNALNNLGNALQDKNELETAIDVYQKLLQEQPDNAKALSNLANALQKQDALEQAIESYKKALEVQPNYALAYNNLGNAYLRKGDVDQAIENYQKAIDNDPDYPEARFHIGMAYLLKGELEVGFANYEYRWQMKEFIEKNGKPQFDEPKWEGQQLNGETVLVVNEQGIGDRIQFIRYASLIKARGGRVLYECPKIFYRLFATFKDIDFLIPEGSPRPKFDYYIHIQSIPAVVNTNLTNIPAQIPYLFTPIDNSQSIIDITDSIDKKHIKVGLVWASSLTHKTSPRRSVPLSLLQELLDIENVQFFSLQKEMKDEDKELLHTLKIIDLKDELNDFADTATAIDRLDLVISVDTAVAHLAGAMGKPVWIMLPFMPDWRWMLHQDYSPWYPTARLFRQSQSKNWQTVLQSIKQSLSSFVPTEVVLSTQLKRSNNEIKQIVEILQRKHEGLKIAQKSISAYQSANYQEALDYGKQALEIEPEHPEVLNMMGVSSYKIGDIEKGIEYLKRAVKLAPKHKDIHANLGLILDRANRIPEAVEHLKQAVLLNPTPEVHNNLGNAYQKLGDNANAIEQYKLAISYGKKDPKHYFNLGNALKAINELDQALNYFHQAIEIKPDYARAYDGIGLVYSAQGKLEEAIPNYQKAIEFDPNNSLYHLHLGNAYARKKEYEPAQKELNRALELNSNCVEALRSLAGIAIEHKQGETAVQILTRALELTPYCPDTRVNLAVALIQLERFTEAEKFLQEALQIKPNYAEAYINLGVIANKKEDFETACRHFQQAIEIKPDVIGAYLNYGLALAMQERLEEAITAFRSVLNYEPNHPDAHMNIGIALMSLGKLKEGWAQYEWRHRVQEYNSRIHRLSQPLWDGKPFLHKTLLIYTEQGLGDCIQFSRYIPLVKAMGGRVIVECNQELLRNIMKRVQGVDDVYVIGEELPPFDCHYPLMSLPHLLGIDLPTIPHNIPHIEIPPNLVELPKKSDQKLKVGIVWTANLGNPTTGKKRTIPLTDFLPILEVEGVDFYILQKDIFEQERPLLEQYNDRVIYLMPLLKDLTDTASLVQQLDLVITVDTMIGHLAGTFGVPTWIILPFAPDWRWFLKGSDTPWYRSVRLFRRFAQEDWLPAIRRVKQQLELQQLQFERIIEKEKYCRLIKNNPNYGEAYNNLGTIEIVLGNIDNAVNLLQRSVELCPNLTEAKLNLAIALLSQGNLQKGLELYLYRWQVEGFYNHNQRLNYSQPLWDGKENISDKVLYVHPEQGFGDQIQFIRYLPLIRDKVKAIYYGCHKTLVRLFQKLNYIDRLVKDGDTFPNYDYYIPLGNLPNLFNEIPFTEGYLPQRESSKWASFFQPFMDKLKVGVVWQTNSNHPTAKERSIGLPYLHQLFYCRRINFFIIQPVIDDTDQDILRIHRDNVLDLSQDIKDFADTAEIINYLDLVITIDSAVAHLSGAMGKTTWLILPFVPDWRWQYNWYKSITIFRQSKLNDLQSVIDDIVNKLETLLPGSIMSKSIEELVNQAAISYQNKDIDRTIILLKQAAVIAPDRYDLLFNLGNLYGQIGKIEEAIDTFKIIYQQNSEYPNLKESIAKAYFNWGNSYNEKGEFRQAIELYTKALEYNPSLAKAHTNLGIAYGKIGELDRSIYHYQESIKLHPNHAEVYSNLGTTLHQHDRYNEARESYEQAIKIKSDYAQAHNGLAAIYRDTGNLESAILHHSAAISINPTYANARFNLAQTLLLAGRFQEGWAEYEWRFKSKQFLEQGFVEPKFTQPMWDGSDLFGKSILILSEQGIGDQIQFIRYAKILKEKGAVRIFYACPEPLLDLFRSVSWIDELVLPEKSLPAFDYWVSLMSLPYLCQTDIDSIPVSVPYLPAPFDFSSRNNFGGGLVGICWASRSASPSAIRRSSSLREFLTFCSVKNLRFVSLQKEINDEEKQLLADYNIADLGSSCQNFYDTAKLIQNLDLVITIDTSVAHLAAAIGKPTWILLNYSPDWRWLTDRSDSPWYPTVRLFRQKSYDTDNWEEVIQDIKNALELMLSSLPDSKEFNLALSYYRSGDFAQSIDILESLIKQGQDLVRANHLLGVIKVAQKPELALPYLYKALTYYPLEGGICHALGGALVHLRCLESALFYLHRSLQYESQSIETWNNLGSAYGYLNLYQESISSYQQSIKVKDNPEARFGIAINLLKQGNYAQGFKEYEWRWQQVSFQQNNPLPPFTQPRWDGSNLEGKTILVCAEQGAGDQIQFWRFFDTLRQRGTEKIIYACPAELVNLCRLIPEVDLIVEHGQPIPEFDYWIPLLSLPLVMGITLDNLPTASKYLQAPPLPPEMEHLFDQPGKTKVGLTWACKKDHQTFIDRSIPFRVLQTLFNIPDVEFYLLQKDIPENDRQFIDRYSNLINLQSYLTDFSITAAIIDRLDLVITVDTAVAHLAGALAKDTWILLPFAADWRWLNDRSDSPWYASVKLLRQQKIGYWEDVICQVREQLQSKNARQTPVVQQKQKKIAIGWSLGLNTGWGVFGTNLALQMVCSSDFYPILLAAGGLEAGHYNPLSQKLISPIVQEWRQFQQFVNQNPQGVFQLDVPVIHALGNGLSCGSREKFIGSKNIGFIFFENTLITPEDKQRAKQYDIILAGSSWNTKVLKQNGIENVHTVLQGIDPTLFHPAPKSGLFSDRFVIFSGGKIEFRKGQDIVVAAFKRFYQKHPDALLVFAWHNFWSQFMLGMDQTGNVKGLPQLQEDQKRLNITAWLLENGLPSDSFYDVGLVPNYLMPLVYREADVALFPNRCEGGTNLVAMECLACGVPTILSANTGHLDLIDESHCYPLVKQRPVPAHPIFPGTQDWGESDIAEIVEVLERVYNDRGHAKEKAIKASQFMQNLTWAKQTNHLLKKLR